MSRSADAHRHPDRDREGLLPRPGDRRLERGASRHRARSRLSRTPKSAPGFIVEALRRRRAAGVPPFTVLTCDNLPSNGRTVKRVLTRFAELVDPELGRFVADEVSCPSTMVDRIVPATTDEDRERIAQALGVDRRLAGRDRAFHPVGDRGPLPAGPPGLGDGRRRVRGGCRALRAHEAQAAQRQPLDARLSRLSRRLRDRCRHHGRSGLRAADPGADGRGGHADAAHAAGRRSRPPTSARSSSASRTRP